MFSKKLSKTYLNRSYLDNLAERYLNNSIICSIDFETTGLSPYNTDSIVFAYSIGYQDGTIEVYRVDLDDYKKNIANWNRLKEFFKNVLIGKTAHNLKFELGFLHKHNIEVPKNTIWHDTMIMSQMLRNNAPSHALDRLCWELSRGTYKMDTDLEVKLQAKAYGNYQKVPEYLMKKYQALDAERGIILCDLFLPEIEEKEKLLIDYINEIELIKATRQMESSGITLDREETDRLIVWLTNELKKVDKETYVLLGEDVNLMSPEDVSEILFERYECPIITISTKSRKPKVDKEVILSLRSLFPENPIFNLILRTRSYVKGLAMVKSYKKFAGESGIIHPNIKTNHAITGRQASSNPNLQNVSKEAVLKNPYPVPARKCFRPPLDEVLYLVDYSGIEIRLIIDATGEPYMMKLIKEGGDPHVVAAECFYGKVFTNEKDPKQKKVLRSAAKNGQFAIAYGAGLSKLATTLGLSIMEARPGYESYKRRFKLIANATNLTASIIREQGYIETPYGRNLKVNPSKAYAGFNNLIQHIAAIILKRAQVRLYRYFSEVWDNKLQMVLPIHDEIIFSCTNKYVKHENIFVPQVSRIMTTIEEINAPLAVEWKKTTSTWDKAKEFII